ncbi:MAG: homocysteine S-methyltransferase family protein [Rhizobiales bacterium]|nr:homocysteine S-methyltransferase family protein [Hyphomicrobiales bacterium]
MAKYRSALPQLGDRPFLTDGGLETTLLFLNGLDLPCFASFPLLETADGRKHLKEYFRPYLEVAKQHGSGFILDTATWRANTDWGAKLDYSQADLDRINRDAVAFAKEVRNAFETPAMPIVINGAIGPRGDGYRPDALMSVEAAARYHRPQVEAFRDAGADMVSAITMNYFEEAAGITLAAQRSGMPVVVSFTVETDGKLPTGETLRSAVERLDTFTGKAPVYYMINCAHPEHFNTVLEKGAWLERIRGIRCNASTKSHAELDESTELDIGDIAGLADHYSDLRKRLPNLVVMGGCCGTDHRHIEAISDRCLAA